MINKDTIICCSFSGKAGNFGCEFFNSAFQKLKMNWIYKSFSVNDIEGALDAMRLLSIRGAGISMPFKGEVLKYVDRMDGAAEEIGAANTVVNDRGDLVAYNTDWMAVHHLLDEWDTGHVTILGKGGYASAVKYAARKLGMTYGVITRKDWDQIGLLKEELVFNCTPVAGIQVDPSCQFIDCIVGTETGNRLAEIQARKQFELYVGRAYEKILFESLFVGEQGAKDASE